MEENLVELSIEMEPNEEQPNPPFYGNDYEVCVVRLAGRDKVTIVETTFAERPNVVPRWLRYIERDYRHRRAPLLASVAFYTSSTLRFWYGRQMRHRPKERIRGVAICLGGTHCLVFQVDGYYDCDAKHAFRCLLEDRRFKIVGIGMMEFVARAKEEWGVHVASPVELRSLVAAAVKEKKLEVGAAIESMRVEKMAEVFLDGIKLDKEIEHADWGRDLRGENAEEMVMDATCEAFLAFEVGKKCFELIDRKADIGDH